MKSSVFFAIIAFSSAFTFLYSCTNEDSSTDKAANDSSAVSMPSDARMDILSRLNQAAELVTTEVKVRKIAIYDSSKQEKFQWTKPTTWKIGERKCIVPVEVTIKYGYDLTELTVDNIKLTDDSTAVIIFLPEPHIIDAGYNTEIESESVVNISTGMRSEIGHALTEEIKHKGYEAIMKEDVSSLVKRDIEHNTRMVFESIIKSIGWENVQVVTTH